jgi:broad specificity phosphatase PhoE
MVRRSGIPPAGPAGFAPDAQGVEQARAAGGFLQRILPEELDVVLETSPLGRARATAELIAVELRIGGRDIRSSPLLMEHALAVWEGLTYAEIDDRFPGARQAREADKWRYVIEGGQSYALASERAQRWLAGWTAPLIVAVTHEMMSRALRVPTRHCRRLRPWPVHIRRTGCIGSTVAKLPRWSLPNDDHAARREREGDGRARAERPLDPGAGGEQGAGPRVDGILHVGAEVARLGDLA